MKKLFLTLFVATMCFAATSADAIIVTGDVTGGAADTQGGVFVQLTPPIGNVGQNNHQTPNLYGFNEDQNIVISVNLNSDIGSNLVVGDTVASHYIFYDPDASTRMQGYVVFDSNILAVMTSKDNLDATDFLANVSANYLSPALRGLEPSQDTVWIDPGNAKRLNLNLLASDPGDYIRVLTERSPGGDRLNAVPEPMTMALFGTGLLGAGIVRRRKA